MLFDKKILRAQFIACFADTAVVARTVFTILLEHRALARTVFTTLFTQIKLQAAASYRLKAASYRQATSYRLQLEAACHELQYRFFTFFLGRPMGPIQPV